MTYEGYTFGHVSAIRPERAAKGTVYHVELLVERGWQIPTDSIARIHSEGVLADTVVEISEGKTQAFVDVGGAIRGEQGVDLLAAVVEIGSNISTLSAYAPNLLESLNRSVIEIGGELKQRLPAMFDVVGALVARLDKSATYLSGMLNVDTEAQARRMLTNFDGAAADFCSPAAGLAEVKEKAQQLMSQLDALVAQSGPDLRQTVTDLRRFVWQVARYSDGILQDLDSTSRNMSEFS